MVIKIDELLLGDLISFITNNRVEDEFWLYLGRYRDSFAFFPMTEWVRINYQRNSTNNPEAKTFLIISQNAVVKHVELHSRVLEEIQRVKNEENKE